MHIPDGFLSTPVWATLDALALPAVAWAARRASPQNEEARVPLMGVMGAFVFAAQTVNFPVGMGTSGHLAGGALLAVVLGPAAAAVVMTAVLVMQALILQDGGVLALGANVCNMALAGVAAGYLPVRLAGRTAGTVFLGGMLSVVVSASLALGQLLLSGVAMPERLLWASAGVFAMNGLVEGAITVAAVSAIARMQPRGLVEAPVPQPRALVAIGAAAAILLMAGAWVASSDPDGLQMLLTTPARLR